VDAAHEVAEFGQGLARVLLGLHQQRLGRSRVVVHEALDGVQVHAE
jgi:hypothetical protein